MNVPALVVVSPRYAWWLAAFLASALQGMAATSLPAAGVEKIFEWKPFLAPFHAVVLHFPIGFLTVTFILELYRYFRPSEELRRVNTLILSLSLVSGLIAATFGLMRAGTGGYDPHALELHRCFGLAVLGVTFFTLVLQRIAYRTPARLGWTLAYRGLLAVTLGLLVLAGHLGGSLTHGANYLVENAPEFVRELFEEETKTSAETAATLNEKERFYLEKVQPVFSSKCYACHGPEKQKGGYRIDLPDRALKSGDSEKSAIKPFDPLGSHLVQLVLLPSDHDDVMPPAGKKALLIEEMAVILEWIRNGAVFPKALGAATERIAGME